MRRQLVNLLLLVLDGEAGAEEIGLNRIEVAEEEPAPPGRGPKGGQFRFETSDFVPDRSDASGGMVELSFEVKFLMADRGVTDIERGQVVLKLEELFELGCLFRERLE